MPVRPQPTPTLNFHYALTLTFHYALIAFTSFLALISLSSSCAASRSA